MMRLGAYARNQRLQALAQAIDSGGPGQLTLYSGTRPGQPSDSPPGPALAVIPLPLPVAESVDAGQLTLRAIDAGMATRAGVASWGRIRNGNGVVIADMDIAEAGADLTISTVNLLPGVLVQIDTAVISEP